MSICKAQHCQPRFTQFDNTVVFCLLSLLLCSLHPSAPCIHLLPASICFSLHLLSSLPLVQAGRRETETTEGGRVAREEGGNHPSSSNPGCLPFLSFLPFLPFLACVSCSLPSHVLLLCCCSLPCSLSPFLARARLGCLRGSALSMLSPLAQACLLPCSYLQLAAALVCVSCLMLL
jgi:hypothetical protein